MSHFLTSSPHFIHDHICLLAADVDSPNDTLRKLDYAVWIWCTMLAEFVEAVIRRVSSVLVLLLENLEMMQPGRAGRVTCVVSD